MTDSDHVLIIPAAGMGTRMRPVNPILPKELLPAGNKPLILRALEEGLSAGITRAAVILHKDKEIVRAYLEDDSLADGLYPGSLDARAGLRKNMQIHFFYQEKRLGECDAVLHAADFAAGKPAAILYPDNVFFPAGKILSRMRKMYPRSPGQVLPLMRVHNKNRKGFSCSGRVKVSQIEQNVFQIRAFLPKQSGPYVLQEEDELRTCGISLCSPEYLGSIVRAREELQSIELTDTVVRQRMLAKGQIFWGFEFPGRVFDAGNPEGFRLLWKYLYSGR